MLSSALASSAAAQHRVVTHILEDDAVATEGAESIACDVYEVTCIPGTQPARGLLRMGSARWLQVKDFCRSASHQDWLPPYVGDGAQPAVQLQASKCYACPANSLLPRHGEGAHALSECTRERYEVLQCSHVALVSPGLAARMPARFQALPRAVSSEVDVLLAVSDNRGHGLFAIVERVVNQVLYARAHGLEPYVFVGQHVFAEGLTCEVRFIN